MYKNQRIIAIIPARGGSVGLPMKNIKELCGKPLIAWSIESAKNSKYLDEIMVTSDHQDIIQIAQDFGANTPFVRPAHLAINEASSIDTVFHTINYYEDTLSQKFDYILLLEPTSPLRELDDIDTMIEKLIDNAHIYDSLCSIGEAATHPAIVKKIENNQLVPFCNDLPLTYRRQDNDIAYFPYGVGYLVKTTALKNEKTFYTQRNGYHIIKRYQCYEIDDIYDFIAIENILHYQRSQNGHN